MSTDVKTVFYHPTELAAHPEIVFSFEKYLDELTGGRVIAESDDIVADYAFPLGDDVVYCEIKTLQDFFSSITEKRLFAQIHRMRETSSFPPLLVIYDLGGLKYRVKRVYAEGWRERWRRLMHVLDGLVAAYYPSPLKVHMLDSGDDVAYFLASLAYHLYVKRHDRVVPVSVSAADPDEPLVAALSAIPGVNRKIAVALLSRFGSIRAIAEAPLDEIVATRTEGGRRIPLRVAKNVKAFFTRRYGDPAPPPWLRVEGEES